MNSEILERHFERLKGLFAGAMLTQRPDGTALVRIRDFSLPAGWNPGRTDLVFLIPLGYPVARPDCFWVRADVRLATGAQPANSAINNAHGDPEPMLWFSFHPTTWNPNHDNLVTYVRIIERRLVDLR